MIVSLSKRTVQPLAERYTDTPANSKACSTNWGKPSISNTRSEKIFFGLVWQQLMSLVE